MMNISEAPARRSNTLRWSVVFLCSVRPAGLKSLPISLEKESPAIKEEEEEEEYEYLAKNQMWQSNAMRWRGPHVERVYKSFTQTARLTVRPPFSSRYLVKWLMKRRVMNTTAKVLHAQTKCHNTGISISSHDEYNYGRIASLVKDQVMFWMLSVII